jgi:hypothetical protein
MKAKLLKFLDGFAEAACYLIGTCAFVGAIYMVCDGGVKLHTYFACAKQCECNK